MASSRDYLEFVLDQLSELKDLFESMYDELPAPKKRVKK